MSPLMSKAVCLLMLLCLSACGAGESPPAAPQAPATSRATAEGALDEGQIRQGVACVLDARPIAGRSLNTTLNYLDTIRGKKVNEYSAGMSRLGQQLIASNQRESLSCL